MQTARQRVVGRRQVDRVESRRRRERDQVRRIRVVREDDGLARLQILAERAQLARLEEGPRAGADGADAVELFLVDDPRKLLAEMERLGARGKDRRAFAAKDRRGFLVIRDGVQTVESGVGGASEYDGADRELH